VSIERLGGVGALRMASEIQRRYARVGSVGRGVALILRRLQSLSTRHTHVHRSYSFARQLSLFPRLSFQMANNRIFEAAPRAIQRISVERIESFTRRVDEKFVRAPSMATRATPSPALDSHAGGAQGPATPPRPVRAVERILAKPAAIAAAVPPAQTAPAVTSKDPPLGPISLAAARSAFEPSAAPDINRLAGEVLRVIDKRIIAHRERSGRR
jgi:hypothetical protein